MNIQNNKKKRIIFFGTPDFANFILEKMTVTEFKPIAVFTSIDKPFGRKRILTPPIVKKTAEKYQIPVYQLKSLKDDEVKEKILSLKPDLFVVAAYGLILPKNILETPIFGALNIHPSLLPKYRGASPIQNAILNKDYETGVTIMLMDEEIDHGPIIKQEKIILKEENYQELEKKLADLGVNLLIKTLPDWLTKKITPIPQKHEKATFTKQIRKEDGKIDWYQGAEQIRQMLKAYQLWPGIYTYFEEKIIKILDLEILEKSHQEDPGKIFLIDKNLAIACGKNFIILKKIQLEGGKPIDSKSFLNGHQRIINQILK
jgi:methionyl-tRNA formyltransferase